MKNFLLNQRGSIAVIFGIAITVIAVMAGGAVDFGRALNTQQKLQDAADATVLALVNDPLIPEEKEESDKYVEEVFKANYDSPQEVEISLAFERTEDGAVLDATTRVPTTFLGLINMEKLDVAVKTKALTGTGSMELALVLDITGSMRDHMGSLKQGANGLVDVLFKNTSSDGIKIAVVPYVGAVNIGGNTPLDWMDTGGNAKWHADNLEYRWFAYEPGCQYNGSSGSGPGTPTGGGDRSDLNLEAVTKFAQVFFRQIGISRAKAADGSMVPPPFELGSSNCHIANPGKLNHFDLFDKIPNAGWKGCVEARPEPFDVDDTAPSFSNADTLWVPYFWPDEPSQGPSHVYFDYPNSYLSDGADHVPSPFIYDAEYHNFYSITKYADVAADIDEIPPVTRGPNASCPDELLPLSNSKSQVTSMIESLSHWEGSGTNAAQGLVWGWRVLSPSVPFTEGKPYGETNKVIVLMTDGKNMAVENEGAGLTEYTAYGYLNHGRMPERTYASYKNYLDDRMMQACANAKEAGITIYTITFGDLDESTRALYRQCASKPPYHYSADSTEKLITAFGQLSKKLVNTRLAY